MDEIFNVNTSIALEEDNACLENILEDLLNISEETEKLIAEQYPYLKIDSITTDDYLGDNIHKNGDKKKSFKCNACSMTFSHRYRMVRHLETHSLRKVLECHHCEKKFNHRNSLILHVKSHFRKCRQNKCLLCNKLLVHKCVECNMEFYARVQLRNHKKMHNSKGNLKCEFCQKEFALQRHLTLHKKVHLRTEEFNCDRCSKKFNNRKTFKAHLICHSEERTHACGVCGSKFQRKNALTEHRKLHNSAKEYSCDLCDRKFAQFAGLYIHMKMHSLSHVNQYVLHNQTLHSPHSLLTAATKNSSFQKKKKKKKLPSSFASLVYCNFSKKNTSQTNKFKIVYLFNNYPSIMSKFVKKEKQSSFADEDNIKCGEIMFSNNTKFCFSCAFCQKNCDKIQEFYRHVLYDHLNYLEEYQFDEDLDFVSEKKLDQSKTTKDDKTEFIDIDVMEGSNKPELKKNNGFSNHFEEFVTQNIPNSVTIKSEVEDEEEEEDIDYKEEIEEFEFFLENDQPSPVTKRTQSPISNTNFNDILHIEFLEEPIENEYEPEDDDIGEIDSIKNESQGEDDNNEEYEDDEEAEGNNSPAEYSNASENEDEDVNTFMIKRQDDTKENNFKCTFPHCKKVFVTKNGAKRHIQNSHTQNKKQVTCSTCFKNFNNQSLLDKHIKLRHMGFKPHECEICGQCFSDRSNLNVHIMRHKGIKPHACSITTCQKRFHSSTELKLHMRSHTGERPFVCELCGREFSNSGHLTNHRRRHFGEKRYECDVCQKRFFDRKLLNDHKVMHSDERPFECLTCGSNFQRKKALLQHEKLHSDVKEYTCKLCGKSFAQNAGLYSHMKGHRIGYNQK
ncbi:zinc finger protein 189-like [Episyrphus balteatus]|uniref:zinc finger protein 189-like n=1 Tax=Episyrphus balteatus TaxID=286459 RepID=UPI002485E42C|nr:zinc finger protein 189-like [Episyrphus balteatus]